MKLFRTIKNNFVIILLVLSSIGLGILALSTALELRETRSPTPADTRALSPPCSVTFTISDTAPRDGITIITPSPTIIAKVQTSVTKTVVQPSPTITLAPSTAPSPTTPIGSINPTVTPTKTPAPTLASTKTPTPEITTLPQTGGTTSTTPTVVQPDVPVAGSLLPTMGIIGLGIILLLYSFTLRRR